MKQSLLQTLKQIKSSIETKKAETIKLELKKIQQINQQKKRIHKISNNQYQSNNKTLSITKTSPNLFKGLCFCFPIKDIDLSYKKVDILKNRIIKYGGKMLQIGDKGERIDKCWLYLVSQKVTKIELKKVIDDQNMYYNCLKYSYVNDCIQSNSLLCEEKYWLQALKNQKQVLKIQEQTQQEQLNELFQKQQKLSSQNKQDNISSLLKDKNVDYQLTRKKSNPELLQDILDIKNTLSQNTLKVIELQPLINLQNSRRKKKQQYWNSQKDKFLCQKGSQHQNNCQYKQNNNLIAQELKKLQKIYQLDKDKGRIIAYTRAISIIKGLPYDIKNVKDVDGIHCIGDKLKSKIKELLQCGKLRKVQNMHKNDKYSAAEELQRVWGIGPAKAIELYNRGIKWIDELRKNQDLLNKNQKIGLKYLQQIQQRIPRQQVRQIQKIVKQTIYQLVGSRNLHKIEACGSYRRGKQTCGDVDIIITRIDGNYQHGLLLKLIRKLEQTNFIVENLNLSGENKMKQSCLTYMGICKFQFNPHRRIDIKYYHYQQFAFALLHFTGSDLFNRSMRLFARKKGYSLSDHRLVPVAYKDKQQKWKGNKIVCFEEKDIFDFLGIDYKTPKERDIK